MTLLADYQARWSVQLRANVSNPQDTPATTPNTALEALAASDVSGRFQAICGAVYDSTNSIHVDACIGPVYVRLQTWTGQVDMSAYEAVTAWFDTVKLVLGRDRLTPMTDSPLSVTPEPFGAQVLSDWTKFTKTIPSLWAPGGGGSLTSDQIGEGLGG